MYECLDDKYCVLISYLASLGSGSCLLIFVYKKGSVLLSISKSQMMSNFKTRIGIYLLREPTSLKFQ